MKLLERERNTKTNMTRTKYVHANAQMNVIVLRSDVRADAECKKIQNLEIIFDSAEAEACSNFNEGLWTLFSAGSS